MSKISTKQRQLYDILKRCLKEYRDTIMESDKNKVYESAYNITLHNEIVSYFGSEPVSEKVVGLLLESDNPLDAIWNRYLKIDGLDILNLIRDTVSTWDEEL